MKMMPRLFRQVPVEMKAAVIKERRTNLEVGIVDGGRGVGGRGSRVEVKIGDAGG